MEARMYARYQRKIAAREAAARVKSAVNTYPVISKKWKSKKIWSNSRCFG